MAPRCNDCSSARSTNVRMSSCSWSIPAACACTKPKPRSGHSRRRCARCSTCGVQAFRRSRSSPVPRSAALAAACEHLRLLPDSRFGRSGPGVIETVHGKAELDAGDPDAVPALFGASARVAAGIGTMQDDDIDSSRDTIRVAAQHPARFDGAMMGKWDATLAARLAAAGLAPAQAAESPSAFSIPEDAKAVDPMGWLWRIHGSNVHVLRPLSPLAFDPAVAVAIARAIADGLPPYAPLVVVEDLPGHATTRVAEVLGVSEYLAAHAARLAMLRWEGHAVLGLLAGRGHGAAFFANASQATTLDALAGARIEAMAVEAIARVTRLPARAPR